MATLRRSLWNSLKNKYARANAWMNGSRHRQEGVLQGAVAINGCIIIGALAAHNVIFAKKHKKQFEKTNDPDFIRAQERAFDEMCRIHFEEYDVEKAARIKARKKARKAKRLAKLANAE
jgi:PBP1b-binding outer membrane lipoprotein LpoB